MANRKYRVSFSDEKAIHHQKGTDKMPKRQLLPEGDDEFKPKVMKGIVQETKSQVEEVIAKINKSKRLGVKDLLDLTRKELDKVMPKTIKEQILRVIEQGQSPVKGQAKYKKYSDSYKDQIKKGVHPGKKQTPVNLKLTGKLHKSLKVEKK